MQDFHILSTNIYDPKLTDKILIIGTCLLRLYPEIVENFSKDYGGNAFHICLEQNHYNQLMSKMLNILAVGKIKEVTYLTVDGSPHCVQVHFSAKYLKRALKNEVNFKHFVIDKEGQIHEITTEEVDASKNFGKV